MTSAIAHTLDIMWNSVIITEIVFHGVVNISDDMAAISVVVSHGNHHSDQ